MIQMLKNRPACLNFSKAFFGRQCNFREAYTKGKNIYLTII